MRYIMAIIVGLTAAAVLTAQTPETRRRVDSLMFEWEMLWRRSDSLRIESMFIRMRADSLRRTDTLAAPPPSADTASLEVDSLILRRIREGRAPRGTTLSDSITAQLIRHDGEVGVASFYAEKFHGRRTASGEVYDMHAQTCAHRWLPFGTWLRVTNISNAKSVVVRVNDRGPWKHTRVVDLSKTAAAALDIVKKGTATVRINIAPD